MPPLRVDSLEGKNNTLYIGKLISVIADFSSETMKGLRQQYKFLSVERKGLYIQ